MPPVSHGLLICGMAPDNRGVLSQADAVAALDSGDCPATQTMTAPDTGARGMSDEQVERMLRPPAPPPPPWLEPLAELVAEQLRPVVKAEVRAAMRARRESS
jgi:hypothetical protein